MNKILSTVFALILNFSSIHGVIFEVKDLSKFEEEAGKLNATALVLFDIDYTLLTPKDVSLKPCGKGLRRKYLYVLDPQRKKWLESITGLEGEEELMDSQFPSLIKRMQNSNIPVIGFTALEIGEYGKIASLEDWRLNRLKMFGIDFSSAFPIDKILVLNESCTSDGHHPIFKRGVLFTHGLLKGEIFTYFLKVIDWKPSKILFMDDSLAQLESVALVADALNIEFIGFHYVASVTTPYDFNQELGEFQFRNLVENGQWLTDTEAKKVLKERLCY